MTAVVGILNTSAVALAADSAVTVAGPNGQKIYNTGNKIFQLSKKQPIGIAIYGSGSLMITPWEVIIKSYRKHLGDNSFKRVVDYRDDFLNYLKNQNYFTQGLGASLVITTAVVNILNDVTNAVQQAISTNFPNVGIGTLSPEQNQQIQDLAKQVLDEMRVFYSGGPNSSGGFDSLDLTTFLTELDVSLSGGNPPVSLDAIWARHPFTITGIADDQLYQKVKELIHVYFQKTDYSYSSYTGLVFVGYGDDEIYPQSNCIEMAEVLGQHVRWRLHSDKGVSESERAHLVPFAQTEVITNLTDGISPKLEVELSNIMRNIFQQFGADVSQMVRPANQTLANHLAALNVEPLVRAFSDSLQAIKNQFFITPTRDAITLFSKEDLAEMAESLVYLTYLQKRMTLDAETVSKPVDVAVISKNDGFVWIKRKYYFEQSLNPHFLRNYFE